MKLTTAEYDPVTFKHLSGTIPTHWYCPVCIQRIPIEESQCGHFGFSDKSQVGKSDPWIRSK